MNQGKMASIPSDGADALPKIEYCIFDMDGLLIDTERIYTDVTNEILAPHGLEMTWDIKMGAMGKPSREAAKHILDSYPGLADKLSIDDYLYRREEMQNERWRTVPAMKGAAELVQHLHAHGIPIALATGSKKRALLEKTLFPEDCILTADSPQVAQGRGKPFPDIFLAAARALGRQVGEGPEAASGAERSERKKALVFEDAVFGVQAGVAAGMNVIWVPDPALKALDPSENFGAARTIVSLDQLDLAEWGLPPLNVAVN